MNYTYYRRYRPSPRRSSFKSFFWLVLILVAMLLVLKGCVSVVGALLKEKQDQATLTLNEGSAQVLEWGQTELKDASSAQLLLVGDTVQTGAKSIVTLAFYNGTTVVLDENTKISFAEATLEDSTENIRLDLLEGRAWVKQIPEDETKLSLGLHTDVMNISSVSANYLVANQANKEYIYGFDGNASVDFVDRSQEDSVIDTAEISKGKKSVLTDDLEKNLLARQSVTLMGDAGDDLIGDAFVSWNRDGPSAVMLDPGTDPAAPAVDATATTETSATDDVETPALETPTPAPVSSLQIAVSSPALTSTIQKSAIAIEGGIVSGTADHVTVTWDGNGKPYTLAGFKAGGSSFRYVADASYGNLKSGPNTFTVVAYAADGTVSNTVTVVVTGDF